MVLIDWWRGLTMFLKCQKSKAVKGVWQVEANRDIYKIVKILSQPAPSCDNPHQWLRRVNYPLRWTLTRA